MFGFPVRSFTPDRWLTGAVQVGNQLLSVIHCPGHAGPCLLLSRAKSPGDCGDVLFQGSIGGTDFPKGDYDTLVASIRERLRRWG